MTTLPNEWAEDDPSSALIPNEQAWEETGGIPVQIVGHTEERESPQFCSWNTAVIGQSGLITQYPYCTQILPRRERRYKAKFGPVVFVGGATSVVFNNRPDPLTLAVPQGWSVGTSGLVLPDYDSEQPVYAIAIGGTATMAYFDESYAQMERR